MEFQKDIGSRELAGTPAIKSVLQASISFQVKDFVGIDNIEEIEHKYCKEVMELFCKHPQMKILGNQAKKAEAQPYFIRILTEDFQ